MTNLKLKEVSRNEYIAAVKAAGDTVRSHLTEIYSLRVAQWLDVESDRVRFQAVYGGYSTTPAGESRVVTYYMEDCPKCPKTHLPIM